MIKKEGFKRKLDSNCMGWTVGQENQQKRQGETRAKWEILQIKHINKTNLKNLEISSFFFNKNAMGGLKAAGFSYFDICEFNSCPFL